MKSFRRYKTLYHEKRVTENNQLRQGTLDALLAFLLPTPPKRRVTIRVESSPYLYPSLYSSSQREYTYEIADGPRWDEWRAKREAIDAALKEQADRISELWSDIEPKARAYMDWTLAQGKHRPIGIQAPYVMPRDFDEFQGLFERATGLKLSQRDAGHSYYEKTFGNQGWSVAFMEFVRYLDFTVYKCELQRSTFTLAPMEASNMAWKHRQREPACLGEMSSPVRAGWRELGDWLQRSESLKVLDIKIP